MPKSELNIYQRLLEVKKGVPYLQKDTQGFNFKYVSPEDVLETINPLLKEQGLVLIPTVKSVITTEISKTDKNGKAVKEFLFQVSMEMNIVNTDTPTESLVIPWHGSGCNGEEQGFGSALTYGLRYFMLQLFQIPTGKDDPDAKQGIKPAPAPEQATKPAPIVKPVPEAKPSAIAEMAAEQIKEMIKANKLTAADFNATLKAACAKMNLDQSTKLGGMNQEQIVEVMRRVNKMAEGK